MLQNAVGCTSTMPISGVAGIGGYYQLCQPLCQPLPQLCQPPLPQPPLCQPLPQLCQPPLRQPPLPHQATSCSGSTATEPLFLSSGAGVAVAAASAAARVTDRPSAPEGRSCASARSERRSWAI